MNHARPEPVEGRARRSWFDRLTTSVRLALAAAFFIAAVALPAARIDDARAARLAEREEQAARAARRLTPVDDANVDHVTRPFPIKSSTVLRLLLVADAVLLLSVARPYWATNAAHAGLKRCATFAWAPGERWVVVGLTVAGAGLRLMGSNRDLWLDEVLNLSRIRRPIGDTLLQSISPNNHLLNSLLGHLSVDVFGESAWALRLPAILFGVATIPVFYALVRRFSPPRETFLAALALVLSYHHVFFSQDARGFSGYLFGGLLGTLALVDALDSDRPRAWLLYGSAMLVSIASVIIGAALLAAHVMAVSVFKPRRRFYWTVAAVGYATAHLYALMVPDIIGFLVDDYRQQQVGWRFSNELVQVVLRGLALGPAAAVVVLAGAVVATIGVLSYWRQDRLFTSLLLLPELLMASAFLAFAIAIFPRLFLFVLPVALVLFARGAMTLVTWLPDGAARRVGYASAIAGVVVVSSAMLVTWGRYPKQDYRGAKAFVEQARRDGDAVVAVGLATYSYAYYWPEIVRTDRISDLEEIAARNDRVWLIYTFPQDMVWRRPKLHRYIGTQFRELRVFPGTVGDGDLRVNLRSGRPR